MAGTSDQTGYEAYREGSFSYDLPVPNGSYRVTLHLFEPDREGKPGGRVFDVVAEGRPAIRGVDPVKLAGAAWTATRQDFTVAVKDGRLNLAFQPRQGKALVSGIEVVPVR